MTRKKRIPPSSRAVTPLTVTINNLQALSELNKLHVDSGDVLVVTVPSLPDNLHQEYAKAFVSTLRRASKRLDRLIEGEEIGVLYLTHDANIQVASPEIMKRLGWTHRDWERQAEEEE